MRESIQLILRNAGAAPEEATLLAEEVEALGPDELKGVPGDKIVLLGALALIQSAPDLEDALRAFRDHLEESNQALDEFDHARLWQVRAAAAASESAWPRASLAIEEGFRELNDLEGPAARRLRSDLLETSAQILTLRGLWRDARRELERAMHLHEEADDGVAQVEALRQLGALFLSVGDVLEADEVLERALNMIAGAAPDRADLNAELLIQHGLCRLELNDIDGAKECFSRGRTLAATMRDPTTLGMCHLHLSRIALLEDDPAAASAEIQVAQEGVEATTVDIATRETLVAWVHQRRAEVELTRGNAEQAIANYESAWHHAQTSARFSAVERAELLRGFARALSLDDRRAEAAARLEMGLSQLEGTRARALRSTLEDRLREISPGAWTLHKIAQHVGRSRVEVALHEEESEAACEGVATELVVMAGEVFIPASGRNGDDELALLNEMHERVAAAVELYGGMVDEPDGERFRAVFTLPEPRPNDMDRAARAAFCLRTELQRWNRQRGESNRLGLAIGVAHGAVTAGLLGSPRRRSHTVVGEAPRLARGLSGLARRLSQDVILDEVARDRLQSPARFLLRPLGRYRGSRDTEVREVCELFGENDGGAIARKLEEEFDDHRMALQWFFSREFELARDRFVDLESRAAGTSRVDLYRFLRKESELHRRNPPGEDWTGEIPLPGE